jgi:hypothetical protein
MEEKELSEKRSQNYSGSATPLARQAKRVPGLQGNFSAYEEL